MNTAHYDFDRQAFQFTLIDTWNGGSTQQGFIQGGSTPEVQPLTLLYTIFNEKGTPFTYFLLTSCHISSK